VEDIKMLKADEFDDVISILATAYPGLKLTSEGEIQKFRERLEQIQSSVGPSKFYVLKRSGEIVGTMRLLDFNMNMRQQMIDAAGVGMVAVHYLHKKEKVAKQLLYQFLQHYRQKQTNIVLLYAFRPDFYHKMGFGFGPQMFQFKFAPIQFPNTWDKANLRFAGPSDAPQILAYVHKQVAKTHGLIQKTENEVNAWFRNGETKVVIYEHTRGVEGYMVFQYQSAHPENFISNDMHIREFFYDTPEVFGEFMSFLHSEADQIRRVVMNTQDPWFHHVIKDPRNDSDVIIPSVYHETNTAGIGLMYRVLNIRGLFEELTGQCFGPGNITVMFTISDSFFPDNNGSTTVHFSDGIPHVISTNDSCDVEIRMDIAHFSSWIMGTVPLSRLLQYGLAFISDVSYVSLVERLFQLQEGPVCVTAF
jgi:predicted acetyltransferase